MTRNNISDHFNHKMCRLIAGFIFPIIPYSPDLDYHEKTSI